ncbi:MAG: CDP-alcohol phosphatidyltransferase family protein [Aquificaceae bacterium]|nr:MAG: CDP-alcohol phosphatidyltransferase family protein [Aquificaceae bacterium]
MPRGIIESINKRITVPIAKRLKYSPYITPNLITWISFFLSGIVAPFLILKELYPLAGFFVYLGALLDSLDGDLARERNQTSTEGAILDAVLDRYIDLFLIASLTYVSQCWVWGLLAMIGSSLVPYVRAKTEAVGKKSVSTFGSRDVRNLILFLGLILSLPCETLGVLAVISNLSAIHRFYFALKKEV